ncbi:hypothetical protein V8C44DRAFT_314098 [Trichoderma aethiopicum]
MALASAVLCIGGGSGLSINHIFAIILDGISPMRTPTAHQSIDVYLWCDVEGLILFLKVHHYAYPSTASPHRVLCYPNKTDNEQLLLISSPRRHFQFETLSILLLILNTLKSDIHTVVHMVG